MDEALDVGAARAALAAFPGRDHGHERRSMDSWLKQARKASGMTVEQCVNVLRTSTDAYLDFERRSGLLRLVEAGALIRALNPMENAAKMAEINPWIPSFHEQGKATLAIDELPISLKNKGGYGDYLDLCNGWELKKTFGDHLCSILRNLAGALFVALVYELADLLADELNKVLPF